MKTIAEIRADRLARALEEACCAACGSAKKPTCCAKEKDKDVEEAEKPEAVSKGPGGEHHTHAFIQRCVASITQKQPDTDTSRAFAICTAQKKKSPGAAKEKAKEGVPKERVAGYEAALERGRQQRSESMHDRIVQAVRR